MPRFPGGGGSNRDARAHQAVLDAATTLFEELGYDAVTMQAIAARADVGKPTLYRWWKNKAALAHEVMLGAAGGSFRYVETGDLPADLRSFVDQTVQFFDSPLVQAAWPGAAADLRSEPEAWQLAFDTLTRPAVEHLQGVLTRAAERGDCRPGLDATTVFDAITGSCMSRLYTPGRHPSRKRRTDAMVDLLLLGIQ
jgi:AcrR family transcriptional regulator